MGLGGTVSIQTIGIAISVFNRSNMVALNEDEKKVLCLSFLYPS
jgi:hypothetical protein